MASHEDVGLPDERVSWLWVFPEAVDLPEWICAVVVRRAELGQRDSWMQVTVDECSLAVG